MSKSSKSIVYRIELHRVGVNTFMVHEFSEPYSVTFDGDPETIVDDLNVITGLYSNLSKRQKARCGESVAVFIQTVMSSPELLEMARTTFSVCRGSCQVTNMSPDSTVH